MDFKKNNKLKKILSFLLLTLFLFSPIYGVEIVKDVTEGSSEDRSTIQNVIVMGLTIMFFGVLLATFVLICAWIFYKIQSKIEETSREKNDFYFSIFNRDRQNAHFNADARLKKKNWKMMWFFYKRKPVYAKTKKGLKLLGHYDGETDKKENFYILTVYNKLGMFSYRTRAILIPKELKDVIVEKVTLDKQTYITLNCEGIDEVENTNYFLIPLIEDPNKDKSFLDFADLIHKKYFEKLIYRDVIKENLQGYRQNMIDAVEGNLTIQAKRRNE